MKINRECVLFLKLYAFETRQCKKENQKVFKYADTVVRSLCTHAHTYCIAHIHARSIHTQSSLDVAYSIQAKNALSPASFGKMYHRYCPRLDLSSLLSRCLR